MSSGIFSGWVNFHPVGERFTRVTLEFSHRSARIDIQKERASKASGVGAGEAIPVYFEVICAAPGQTLG